MEIELNQKPKNATLIEGFPGYGLVGTIATDFLIKHLNAKQIGRIKSEKVLPMVALHDSKLVDPLGIFYDSKNNIIIIHALSHIQGLEWEIAQTILKLCKTLNIKELVSLEGVASENKDFNTYYYSTKNAAKFEKIGIKPLKEGIIMGATGALLLETKDIPSSCIFVESHISYADSEAAAKVIEVLDRYLNLKVNFKPLLEAAKSFEDKLKIMMQKAKTMQNTNQKSQDLNYLG